MNNLRNIYSYFIELIFGIFEILFSYSVINLIKSENFDESISYLRNFQTVDIATIGDAETKMIIVEYGLEVSNEAAHGVVADLSTS